MTIVRPISLILIKQWLGMQLRLGALLMRYITVIHARIWTSSASTVDAAESIFSL